MKEKIKKHRILLCEDDNNLGTVLKNFLELSDYDVTLERDGRAGFTTFRKQPFDICLLDVMMPKVDGFKLAEDIREHDPEIPLFFLSAKTMKDDIIKGYKLGADDYITKPFDSELLLLKIKAILKRNDDQNAANSNIVYQLGKYIYDAKIRELKLDEASEILSPKEGALLRLLCENLNNLLPREEALKKVWGSDTYFNGRSMDVYVAKLRKFLKDDESIELLNVHGNGFRLMVP
jgi:DNA-binding response OmpR family regulator